MKKTVSFRLAKIVAFTIFLCLTVYTLNAQEKRNAIILDNPSFEEMEAGVPAGWWEFKEVGTAECRVVTETEGTAHSGKSCLMIQGNGADTVASWIVNKVDYQIKGGTTYEFSCWVKSEGVGNTPCLMVWEFEGKNVLVSHKATALNGAWQKASCKFTTKATCNLLQLRLCLFGKGKIYFDDVTLEEIVEGK